MSAIELHTIKERMTLGMINGAFQGFKDMPKMPDDAWKTVIGCAEGTLRFEDLDYKDQNRAGWVTSSHLSRLLTLSLSYRRGEDVRLDSLLSLLDEWLIGDYSNPNWWYCQIGVPSLLVGISLLLWENMNGEQRKAALQIIGRGCFQCHPGLMTRWTGANLLWFAAISIKYALLTEDGDLLRLAVNRAADEIRLSDEGLQADGSFFQHGHRLYSGGYGRSFINELSVLIYCLQGTSYQFTDEKLSLFLRPLLDGLRHMTQGDALDYACVGREYTRPGAVKVGSLTQTLSLLSSVEDLPRVDEIRAYLNAVLEKRSPIDSIRYFPDAALVTAHFDGMYVGFKGTNARLVDAEICNDEAVLGYNLSYGTHTTAMRTGDEYADISPLWDYARIPGTTAAAETDEELSAHPDWSGRTFPDGRFGGGQFGECAICFESVVHEGIHATVSCFATPEGVILLGAGLSDDAGRVLTTTAEQCFAHGEYTVSADGKTVCHNGILYQNLDTGTAWRAETRDVRGSWKRNSLTRSDAPVTGRIFLLTLNAPMTHGTYAYRIGAQTRGVTDVRVLCNTESVQAIRLPDGTVMASFIKDAELRVDGKILTGKSGTCTVFRA